MESTSCFVRDGPDVRSNSEKTDTGGGGINPFYLLPSGTGVIMPGYIKTYVPRTLSLKDLQSQHLAMQLLASNLRGVTLLTKTQGSGGFQAKLFISEITVPFQNLVSYFFSWILWKMRARQWCIIFYHLTLERKLRSPEEELKHRGIWEIATFF